MTFVITSAKVPESTTWRASPGDSWKQLGKVTRDLQTSGLWSAFPLLHSVGRSFLHSFIHPFNRHVLDTRFTAPQPYVDFLLPAELTRTGIFKMTFLNLPLLSPIRAGDRGPPREGTTL